MTEQSNLILVARVISARGIRGETNVLPYTQDRTTVFPKYFRQDGAVLAVQRASANHGKYLHIQFKGVATRNDAEALAGTDLYVPRDQLPPETDDDTFYYHDLVGYDVTYQDKVVACVQAVANFGATDILTLKADDGVVFEVPFHRDAVEDVHKGARTLVLTDMGWAFHALTSTPKKPKDTAREQ